MDNQSTFYAYLKTIGFGFCGAVVSIIAAVMPKKRGLVTIVPRFLGGSDGNTKYYYLYLCQKHSGAVAYITSRDDIFGQFAHHKVPIAKYPSASAIWALLRAEVTVFESEDSARTFVKPLTRGSKKVQLWHGNGLKTISRLKAKYQYRKRNTVWGRVHYIVKMTYNWFVEKHRRYDVVCFSSEAQRKARAQAFEYRDVLINGQPRNDALFRSMSLEEIGADQSALSVISNFRDAGKKIAIYAPTWRRYHATPVSDGLDFDRLNAFLASINTVMVLKLHMKDCTSEVPECSNIVGYSKDSDVYPAMRNSDLMITDYSSIYMDFLLQEKPVIFYAFDRDEYMNDRPLVHEYGQVTPGPVCASQDELESALNSFIIGDDDVWMEKRQRVVREFNAYTDGKSCERLSHYIETKLFQRK